MLSNTFRLRPSIVLFGDSITEQAFGVDGNVGWASLLAAAYSRRADVLNRGFSGYNTSHAVELLPRVFTGPLDSPPLFATVFFGANDAALPGEPQHVPPDDYERNIETIVAHLRRSLLPVRAGEHRTPKNPIGSESTATANVSSPAVPIVILVTPPPVLESAWADFLQTRADTTGETRGSDRDNTTTRLYGERLQRVGIKLSCPVLDCWNLLGGDSEDRGRYLSDGLHLNPAGNRAVFQGLMNLLAREHPEVLPMQDGDGKCGTEGIPVEEALWKELCSG